MLSADMTSRNGAEKSWAVGDTRTVKSPNRIKICQHGYHSCPELAGLRDYLYGPMLCVVEVSEPIASEDTKQVSASRTLVAAFDVARQLREYACDCATRALDLVEASGRKVDPRSRAAVEVARQYARGDASKAALETARESARQAASADAAAAAASSAYAAAASAYAVAADAVAYAAREAEITWQRGRLAELFAPVVVGVTQ